MHVFSYLCNDRQELKFDFGAVLYGGVGTIDGYRVRSCVGRLGGWGVGKKKGVASTQPSERMARKGFARTTESSHAKYIIVLPLLRRDIHHKSQVRYLKEDKSTKTRRSTKKASKGNDPTQA